MRSEDTVRCGAMIRCGAVLCSAPCRLPRPGVCRPHGLSAEPAVWSYFQPSCTRAAHGTRTVPAWHVVGTDYIFSVLPTDLSGTAPGRDGRRRRTGALPPDRGLAAGQGPCRRTGAVPPDRSRAAGQGPYRRTGAVPPDRGRAAGQGAAPPDRGRDAGQRPRPPDRGRAAGQGTRRRTGAAPQTMVRRR